MSISSVLAAVPVPHLVAAASGLAAIAAAAYFILGHRSSSKAAPAAAPVKAELKAVETKVGEAVAKAEAKVGEAVAKVEGKSEEHRQDEPKAEGPKG